MAKYIDADKLLAEAKRISGPMTGDGWSNWGVYSLIERQSAVDLVSVVRCKECTHYNIATDMLGFCERHNKHFEPNDYCSKGDRGGKDKPRTIGVLIKGEKMPSNCGECPCTGFAGNGIDEPYCKADDFYSPVRLDSRPRWCPLEEVLLEEEVVVET